MFKKYHLVLLVFALVLTLFSCKKGGEPTPCFDHSEINSSGDIVIVKGGEPDDKDGDVIGGDGDEDDDGGVIDGGVGTGSGIGVKDDDDNDDDNDDDDSLVSIVG